VQSWSSAVRSTPDGGDADGVTATLRNLRLQDADLQVMSDEGLALSMHQPWASLLVAGIKRSVGLFDTDYLVVFSGYVFVSSEVLCFSFNHFSLFIVTPC